MPVKKIKPTSNARRQMSVSTFEELTKGKKPEKSLLRRFKSIAGRNNHGHLTVRHRGGGVKKMYRLIDFKQVDKINIPGKVVSIEYDPYRTCYIMQVNYKDGAKRYHLAPGSVKVSDSVITAPKAKIKAGNRMEIRNIPVGYEIFNIEINKGKGGQLVRSAGMAAQISSHEGELSQITLPSGEVRYIHKDCYATIGRLGNESHSILSIGKAGRNRKRGKRPEVKGICMNPVDHPHGGGEGHCSIGLIHPKTPWGMPALGYKTRKRKYSDRMIVKSRHQAKK